ncbi:Hypothetical protein NGAL_HAMBI1145_29280 [Neorhizobium galegae bv. officinalis]|uniref:Uncharacterized protein n=1 Tax=Neorhizobium galegae bv. officinalis TaxID=323656 RepID=A0A0T7FKT9_NEOGA|nr:hypothetical protein [Neorhizobium galegae]CDZ35604.1 Hypothetical protein NGAL_HAMBI1145_29280 [Neorhizobium galegae bv. officinalis]
MQAEDFSLASNAFTVLGARYQSTAQEMADLVEDAQYASSRTEGELQKAQQTLVTPRLRLQAEVSWLPELSEAQIAKVLNQSSNMNEASLLQVIANFPDLAKVNAIADMAARRTISKDALSAYLHTWKWFEPEPVLDFLRKTRRTGGFPTPDEKTFQSALHDLRQRHTFSLIKGMMAGPDGPTQLSDTLDAEITGGSPSPLLPSLVKEFEKRCERDQLRIADSINETIENAKLGSIPLAVALPRIGSALQEWDRHARPVLGFYNWRGHAEPRTKNLFHEIREYLLHLTNLDGKLDEARELLLASASWLAHAEELEKVAEKDLFDLDGLITARKEIALFQPLSDACEAAKAAHRDFAKAVKASGMTAEARSPAGPFVQALRTYAEVGDPNLAAAVARDLALFFNNDQENPEIAYRILHGTDDILRSQKVSDETKARLTEDAATIFRNWKIPEIEKEKGNLSRMTALVEAAMTIAPAGVKPEFTALHSGLMDKRRENRTKLVVWAVVIAVIFIPIVFLNSDKKSQSSSSSSSSSYKPSPSPNSTVPSTSSASTSTKPPGVRPVAVEDRSEIKPSPGVGATLSRSELRYCIFQGKRLDLLRTMALSNSAIDKFNGQIADFNLRCSNFRYRETDMTAVTLEASSNSSQFMRDATAVAKGW